MYGPAVPLIKGIPILPDGAAASFIKDIPIPRLSGRGNLYFNGRSGRPFEKEYMYGPAVPFIKGISISSDGAAASFIKDMPIPPAASLLKGIYMYQKERPPL